MCKSQRIVVAIAFMLLVFRCGAALAANIYWDGIGTSWNNTVDWSTASNATTPHPAAVPGSGDVANFNISTVNTAQTVNLDAAQSALALNFTSTGAVTINTGTGTNTLTIGLGGITVAAGSGLDTINAKVTLGIAETWTNNSVDALTVNGSITNGSNTLTIGGSGITNLNGVLSSGSGGLTMSGAGTLNLGPTTYTGATTVSSGTLFLNSSSGFGLSSGVSIAAGATVDLDGFAGSTNITSIAGAGVGGNGALVNSFPFTPGVWSGNVTLSGDTTIGGVGDIPLSGAVTGAHTLTKVGNNTLTLSGSTNNTNLGLTVNAGTVILAKSSSASVHAVDAGLFINGGAVQLGGTGGDQINDGATVIIFSGTFGLNGRSETIGALATTGATPAIVQNASSTAATLTINVPGPNGAFFDYEGVLQDGAGGGALSLIIGGNGGNGEERLAGNDTFTGGVTINSGILAAGSAGALNAIQPNAVTFGPGSTGVLSVGGNHIIVSGLNSNATTVGTPVVQNYSGAAGVLVVSNSGPNTYAGVIQDGVVGAPLSLTKDSSGVLILSGANTYTGATTINGGSLQGGAANTFPAGSAVVLGVAGTFDLGGFAQSIGSLASTFGGAVTTEGATGTDTLTVGNDNTSTAFAGVISNAAGGRLLALTKVGTGTLTLSGNNTFTGPINVIGGTLALGGGTLMADVHNQATFAYSAGTFSGRLFNVGAITSSAPFTIGNGMENDVNLSIPAGQTITLGGLGLDNEGTLTMAGGTLNLSSSGSANNLNRGIFNLSATVPFSLGAGTTLTNAGTLNLNGGLLNGSGTLVNNPGGIVSGNGTIQSSFVNSGGTLIVGGGPTNITPAFTNSGLIQLTAANSDLVGGTITNAVAGTIQGVGVVGNAVTNNGTIESIGGTLSISGPLTNPAGGFLTADAGSKLFITSGLAANGGIVNLTGGTFDNGGHTLNNTGQISGWGIFRSGGAGLDNNGSITFSGGTTTINGNVTNENGKTITVAYNPAIFTGNVINNVGGTFHTTNTTITFAGGFTNNGNSNFISAGNGVVEVTAAPTLNDGSTLSVNGTSTLRFNVVTGTATIGKGVTATVSSGATLELAGSVSALSAGPYRVDITNNSNSTGLVVSGTHQQVGGIDGAGTTVVNAGSDLTANHIVQSALVIGGTATSHGLVTIDASDSSGNPLGQSSGLALAGTLQPSTPFAVSAPGSSSLDLPSDPGFSGNLIPAGPGTDGIGAGGNLSAVPEPSALVLLLFAFCGLAFMARRGCHAHASAD